MSEIMVGVDGSESCYRAVGAAAEWAKEQGAGLSLVHIIAWSPYSFSTPGENEGRPQAKASELTAAKEQVLDPLADVAEANGVNPELIVRHGDPVDLLISLAVERDVTHVVVGRTGDSRLRQKIFGSIPGHLVQVAPFPVTVVP